MATLKRGGVALSSQDKTDIKTDLGLQNVDNTSDANKPVSTATATALSLKANTADLGTAAFQPTTAFANASHTQAASTISDSTTVGRAVLTAADAAAARTTLGAQAALVSGTNIKTINGSSVLGSGNLSVTAGAPTLVSVTGATTATLGALHICTGTSANYTIALPAVSGNAGAEVSFIMSSALTRLVTLDGNGSETIDGALTRVMWAGETATLYCDGTAWFKRSGRSLPMIVSMYKATNEAMAASGTAKKHAVDTVLTDNTGRMANTASSRIDILRPGLYVPDSAIWIDPAGIGGLTRNLALLYKNGSATGAPAADLGAFLSAGYSISAFNYQAIAYAAGDYVELWGIAQYSSGSPNFNAANSGSRTHLGLMEIPQW